jgi:hypothetical protein
MFAVVRKTKRVHLKCPTYVPGTGEWGDSSQCAHDFDLKVVVSTNTDCVHQVSVAQEEYGIYRTYRCILVAEVY